MAGDITESGVIDWGAIEAGSFLVIADTMFMLYALLKEEGARREQVLRTKAPEIRQDRVAMMGVYSA